MRPLRRTEGCPWSSSARATWIVVPGYSAATAEAYATCSSATTKASADAPAPPSDRANGNPMMPRSFTSSHVCWQNRWVRSSSASRAASRRQACWRTLRASSRSSGSRTLTHHDSSTEVRPSSPSISTRRGCTVTTSRSAPPASATARPLRPAAASSLRVLSVGRIMASRPDPAASTASPTSIQNDASASVPWECAAPLSGSTATKNHVSNRRGSKSGVIQCAHAASRSARSTRPRRRRKVPIASPPLSSSRRSAAHSSPSHTPSTVLTSGPASGLAMRMPVSSKVSRTAATTSARARSTSQCRRFAQVSALGPVHGAGSRSVSCTEPPGKTCMPAAKAMVGWRRSRRTSSLPARSRVTTTVAAWRATATVPSQDSSWSRARADRGRIGARPSCPTAWAATCRVLARAVRG